MQHIVFVPREDVNQVATAQNKSWSKSLDRWLQQAINGLRGGKKMGRTTRERQYAHRLTISQHSSRASEFKQLSCLSDPLWGINGLVERCFRRCLPAPQEPERAIRVRGRGSEGTRVWARNYRLTEEGSGSEGKGVKKMSWIQEMK